MDQAAIKEMSRLEVAANSLTCKDAEKAYSDMIWAVNTFGLDVNGYLELIKQDPKRSKVWTSICWYWVGSLSRRYLKKEYDPRNSKSCTVGYHLQQAIDSKYKPLPELPRNDFVAVFIRCMAYDAHRTNQQSFTSLVFAWLNYLATEKNVGKAKHAVKRVKEDYGDRWLNMPMI